MFKAYEGGRLQRADKLDPGCKKARRLARGVLGLRRL